MVNKPMQGRFVAAFAAAVSLGLAANLLAAYFLIDSELARELYKIHLRVRGTYEIAAPVLLKLGAVTVPSVLIISALIGRYLLRAVEAPLGDFARAVASFGECDLSRRLKDGPLPSLSGTFNGAAVSLGGLFDPVKASVGRIDTAAARLAASIEIDMDRAQLKDALRELSGAREALREGLSRFKVQK